MKGSWTGEMEPLMLEREEMVDERERGLEGKEEEWGGSMKMG